MDFRLWSSVLMHMANEKKPLGARKLFQTLPSTTSNSILCLLFLASAVVASAVVNVPWLMATANALDMHLPCPLLRVDEVFAWFCIHYLREKKEGISIAECHTNVFIAIGNAILYFTTNSMLTGHWPLLEKNKSICGRPRATARNSMQNDLAINAFLAVM